jgi:uncharacterized protein (TIGR02246 family)
MKRFSHLTLGAVFALASQQALLAQESSPEIAGLEKTAADFIVAYNSKNAADIAAMFLEKGEISDAAAQEVTTGRSEIQAKYEAIFAAADAPSIAIEVDSVRLVSENLAIEDGTWHFTSPGVDFPTRSSTYTAVLQKNQAGVWQIASTRSLKDVTTAAGHLSELIQGLKGDWTGQKDGLRVDLAFGWDTTGNFINGEMLVTKPDSEPLTTHFRFAWDAGREIITCWTFDDSGGFATADWTPTESGWQIRTEGTTADGEAMSANQTLTFEGKDTFIWAGKDRLINDELQPDVSFRIVRQAPEPDADLEAKEAPAAGAQ